MKTQHLLLQDQCEGFTLPKSSDNIRACLGGLRNDLLAGKSFDPGEQTANEPGGTGTLAPVLKSLVFNWLLTVIFHCFKNSQPTPQAHTGSCKGSLTDFLNTFRTSNRNSSYNNGFRRLKIITIIIHPQTLNFSTQHHWKTITVLRQSAPRLPCFPKTQNLPSSLFCPDQKHWADWLKSPSPAVLLVFPGSVGNQDPCCKQQPGRAWDARTRQRWQHQHPHSPASQSLAQTRPQSSTRLTRQHSSSISGSAIRWRQANGENLYQFLSKCF